MPESMPDGSFFNPARQQRGMHQRCLDQMSGEAYIKAIAFSALVFIDALLMLGDIWVDPAGIPTLSPEQVEIFTSIGVEIEGDTMTVPGCGAPKSVSKVFSLRALRGSTVKTAVPMRYPVAVAALCRVFAPFRQANHWERHAIAAVLFKKVVDCAIGWPIELPIQVAVDAVVRTGLAPVAGMTAEEAKAIGPRICALVNDMNLLRIVSEEGAREIAASVSLFDYMASFLETRKACVEACRLVGGADLNRVVAPVRGPRKRTREG
jgi:hypothetical protein